MWYRSDSLLVSPLAGITNRLQRFLLTSPEGTSASFLPVHGQPPSPSELALTGKPIYLPGLVQQFCFAEKKARVSSRLAPGHTGRDSKNSGL